MRYLTPAEAATKKAQAAELMRRTGQDDRADEFESMSIEDYAAAKGAEIIEHNPNRRMGSMAKRKTVTEVEAELDEANQYIEELESKLDNIVGIATDDEDEDEEEDEDLDEDQ